MRTSRLRTVNVLVRAGLTASRMTTKVVVSTAVPPAATTVDALVRVDVLEALDGEEAREVVASEGATMAVSMYEGKKNASLTSYLIFSQPAK